MGGAEPDPGGFDWFLHLSGDAVWAGAPRPDASGDGTLVTGRVWGSLKAGDLDSPGEDRVDLFLLRIDEQGKAMGVERFVTDPGGVGSESAVAPIGVAGGVVLGGRVAGTVTFGSGAAGTVIGDATTNNGYVVRVNDDGSVPWHVLVSNGEQSDVADLVAQGGKIYAIGSCEGTLTLDSGTLDCGFTRDWLVARIHPSTGAVEAATRFGGSVNTDIGAEIAALPSGGVVVAGTGFGVVDFGDGPLPYQGNYDVYVAGLDADLSHLWSFGVGSPSSDAVSSIAVGDDGTVALCGSSDGDVVVGGNSYPSAGGWDGVVVLATDGVPTMVRRVGGTGSDHCSSVAFDPDGDLVITGTFDGTIDLGGEMVTATGDRDTFLLTMSRSGEITSVATQAAPAGTENLLSVDHVDAAAGRLVAAQLEAGLDLGGEAFSALGSVDTVVGRLRP